MSTRPQWLSSSKLLDIVDDIFRRTDDDDLPGGTSMHQTPIKLTKELIHHLSHEISIASTSNTDNHDPRSESVILPIDTDFSWERVRSIQSQLIATAGRLQHFHNPRAKSFYLASSSNDIQLIKSVRIVCEFEKFSQPVELTIIFDDENKICCLDFSEAGDNLVFPTDHKKENLNEHKHIENLARLIIYELASQKYDRVLTLFSESHRQGLNLENLKDEFQRSILSTMRWERMVSMAVADDKWMVNLSVSFKRIGRDSFDRELSLIFNNNYMLESITFFED